MNALRRAVVLLGLVGWLYSWYLFRGVRNEYLGATLGPIPTWLIALLGVATTALIATAVTAGFRSRIWPALSAFAGIALAASVLFSQFAVMNSVLEFIGSQGSSAGRATIADAFRAALRSRGALEIVIVTAVPTLLVLGGASGWVLRDSAVPAEIGSADER